MKKSQEAEIKKLINNIVEKQKLPFDEDEVVKKVIDNIKNTEEKKINNKSNKKI